MEQIELEKLTLEEIACIKAYAYLIIQLGVDLVLIATDISEHKYIRIAEALAAQKILQEEGK